MVLRSAKDADDSGLQLATCSVIDELLRTREQFVQEYEVRGNENFTTDQRNTVTGYEGVKVYFRVRKHPLGGPGVVELVVNGPIRLVDTISAMPFYADRWHIDAGKADTDGSASIFFRTRRL